MSYRITRPRAEDKQDIRGVVSHHLDPDHERYEIPFDKLVSSQNTDYVTRIAVNDDNDAIATMSLCVYEGVKSLQQELNGIAVPLESVLVDGENPDLVGLLAYAYVHPEWQHRGIGSELLTRLERIAAHRGIEALFGEAWLYDPAQDARRMIESHGFAEVFHHDEYWPAARLDKHCDTCGGVCTCSGSIYRKWIDTIH